MGATSSHLGVRRSSKRVHAPGEDCGSSDYTGDTVTDTDIVTDTETENETMSV
jgi:hypothetical protein